jgi:hypothetical protein
VVAGREIFDPDPEPAIEAAWRAELQRDREQFATREADDRWGPPESWNDYYLVRARLSITAGKLRAILETCDTHAEYIVETPLADPDTILWGIPDLVVRSPALHAVIDYKTGRARDPDSQDIRESYETQMHLYAYLEFKESGAWPDRSLILSFQDGVVDVEVGPTISMPYVDDALERVASYNRAAPCIPPASPSVVACAFCHYVPRCQPFWQAAPDLASEGLVAVLGVITRIASTPLGGYTIDIQPTRNSHFDEKVIIRRIDPTVHDLAGDLKVGEVICATHLYCMNDEDLARAEWRLGKLGELSPIRA